MMQQASAKQKKAYSLRNFRVLIVEDYEFMADLMVSMLREVGVGHIMHAIDAREAQEMLLLFNSDRGQSPIDVVVTDWLMPGGDGLGLLRWMRDHRFNGIKFMPAVLCSAYVSEETVNAARDNGANESLAKPISAQKMADRILHVIDNPRPFVKAPNFFGPERRRKEEKFKGAEKRKKTAEHIKEFHERL
jgi:two-component system chemotaxis response regulator CheY